MGVRKELEKKEKSKPSLYNRLLSLQTVLSLIFSLVVLYPVNPKRFTVNSLGDDGDANPGDGVCETAIGNSICTLRAASQEAEALLLTHTINLPNNTYNVLQARHITRRSGTTKDSIVTSAAAVTAFPMVYETALDQTSEIKARHCVSLQPDRGPPSI